MGVHSDAVTQKLCSLCLLVMLLTKHTCYWARAFPGRFTGLRVLELVMSWGLCGFPPHYVFPSKGSSCWGQGWAGVCDCLECCNCLGCCCVHSA